MSDPRGTDEPYRRPRILYVIVTIFCLTLIVGFLWPEAKQVTVKPLVTNQPPPSTDESLNTGADRPGANPQAPNTVSMTSMLEIARDALTHTIKNVDSYTARLVKQEQDQNGVLQAATETFIKIQTRHQDGTPGDPMKVYMRFDAPDNAKGREVIWVEDQNDGNLLVREAGMIGAMMTVPLAPNSFLAMREQRYPITELGLTRLLEKLIERGQVDVNDPNVRVVLDKDFAFEGRTHWKLTLTRATPSGVANDFSTAELLLDPEQNVVVHFNSFGWPDNSKEEPPLIESYTYYDLTINAPISDIDFDTSNPEYTFAKPSN